MFQTYLNLGFQHIVDVNGLDHILFVITLCAFYNFTEWKKVGILITAFTLGHSVTLALASLKILIPNSYFIEILIPLTIFISGLFNLIFYKRNTDDKLFLKYGLALFFGLIHGMGFSTYFSFIMGDAANIIYPLFAFNVGIEMGQLFVILMYYSMSWLILRFLKLEYKWFGFVFSSLGVIVSVIMILNRI